MVVRDETLQLLTFVLEVRCPVVVLDLNLLTLDRTQSGPGEKLGFSAITTFTAVSFEVVALKMSRVRPVRNSSNHPAEMIGPG